MRKTGTVAYFSDAASWLRWGGALGIAAVAIARCVVAFAPQIVFDVDPAIDPNRLPALGPAGSLALDAALLVACGCGLLGEALARRRVDWLLVALAVIPAPVIAWHGAADAAHLWRGATWLAAAVAAAAIAHLGRDRSIRLVLIALLAAVLVPLFCRGVVQSSIAVGGIRLIGPEHAGTIAEFEAARDEFFADRGWEQDSAAARVYEHRLRQPDPRGWFPTSNLFASMMAFGLVLFVGLAAGAARDRLGGGWIAFLAAGGLAAAAALLMTRSKGGIGAALAGLALLAAPLAGGRVRAFAQRHGGAIALGLVAAALAAVIARGAVLPESWLGERSLLFRSHYLAGAAQVFAEHPLAGVGPDGFQQAYSVVRSPRSPEVVTSAHNPVADWLAMLGVPGAAWAVLAGILLWRAGRHMAPAPDAGAGYVPARTMLWLTAAVALLVLIPAVVVEAAALDTPGEEMARAAGVIGFVLGAMGLSHCLERTRGAIVNWTLAAAAVALLVHAQVEMTFFDPGTVTWNMCVLGLAGGAAPPKDAARETRRTGIVASVAILVAALAAGVWAARAAIAESLAIKAARLVYPPARSAQQQAAQRQAAAGLLQQAYAEHHASRLLEESARQMLIASELHDEDALRARGAEQAAELAFVNHGTPRALALLCDARWLRARAGDAGWDAAVEAAQMLTEMDPHGVDPWLRLADVLWEAGRRDEAAAAYRRVLQNDANFEIDPLHRMSDGLRERVEARIPAQPQGTD